MRPAELLSRVPNIFKSNILWTTALYDEPAGWEAGDPLTSDPFHRFDTKRLLRRRTDVLSRADPFLFVKDDRLYVFMEAEPEVGPGRIEAWVSEDLRTFTPLGEVLREPFHLSYPFVFAIGDRQYLLPEASAGGGLFLYEFDRWPTGVRRVRRLLSGPYVDSSLLYSRGQWFLFTTSPEGLEIFVTEDLLGGELRRHPLSPVTSDRRVARCGGGLFRTRAGLVRVAQDCSTTYGENLNLLAVDEISESTYSEHLLREHLYPCDRPWNRLGTHHLSYVPFRARTIVAVDGRQSDYYLHRARGLALRAVGR